MSLFLLAVFSSAVIFATASTISKHLIDLQVEDYLFAGAIFGLPFYIVFMLLGLLKGVIRVEPLFVIYSSVSGGLYGLILVLYLKGLNEMEASRFVPSLSLNTIFVTVLSFMFLGQVFSITEYLGIAMTVCGASLISVENPLKDLKELASIRGTQIAVLTAFLIGVRDTLLEAVTAGASLWPALFWAGIGGIIFSSTVLVFFRRERFSIGNTVERADMLGAGGLRSLGFVLYVFSISLGPAAKASALLKVNGVLVVIFATAISYRKPGFIREDVKRQKVIQKLAASALIIVGAAMTV